MTQKKDSTITVRLPELDKLRLEKLAYKRKTTPSSIVQMLIKQKTQMTGD